MRLLSLLSLPVLALLASASPEAHAKFSSLASKSSNNVIKLNSALYDELVAKPRDYGVAVVLTALGPEFNCAPCREFDPQFKALAKQFKRSENKDKLFFATLDFRDGRDIFQRLGLASAPNLQYLPPSTSSNRGEFQSYDFNRLGFSAQNVASFLSAHSPFPVTYTVPFDYTKLFVTLASLLGAAAFARATWSRFLGPLLTNRWAWAAVVMAAIMPLISGYMWTQIRKPPQMVMARDGSGRVQYIAQGYSNMYGIEVQIVSMIYGICAASVLFLSITLPKVDNPKRQRVGVYLWVAVLVITFSMLMSVFRIKQGGYPFSLLF